MKRVYPTKVTHPQTTPYPVPRLDIKSGQKSKPKDKTRKKDNAVLISTYIYIQILSQKIFVYVQNHLFMCKKKCEFGEDEITSSIVSTVCQYGHLASEKPAPPGIPDCDRSMWLSSHDPPPLEDPHVYPLTAPCFGLVRSNLIADL
jgi:hypothetical protein